jgi:hypothetical protein
MPRARTYPRKGSGKSYAWIAAHLDYTGDDCIAWPYHCDQRGRGRLRHDGKSWHAARLMCVLVNGEPPTPEHQAAHSCGNGDKGCMNPRHLSWKTNSENQIERRQHGTNLTFHYGKRSKLTYAQAVEIRALQGTMSADAVGERYGVHANNIYFIWQGKTFKSEKRRDHPLWTPEEDERLREATRRRMSNAEAAAFIGRPAAQLHRRRAKIGCKFRETSATAVVGRDAS